MNTDLTHEQIINDSDKEMAVLGVPGRLTHRTRKPGRPDHLWFKQIWVSDWRPINGYGPNSRIQVEINFDDDCGNGHNSFGMTAEIINDKTRHGDCEACGCLHDQIHEAFPELRHLIKWHFMSTDGPMHYVANTTYLAGDRDCRGKRKGEAWAWDDGVRFGDNPIIKKIKSSFAKWLVEHRSGMGGEWDFEILRYDHVSTDKRDTYKYQPKYTFGDYGSKWHECPFDTEQEATQFLIALKTCNPEFVKTPTLFSDGKERELKAARSCAIWPDASDEILCAEKEVLTAALMKRLPGLIAEFRRDMDSIGFYWSPQEYYAAMRGDAVPAGSDNSSEV